MRLNKTGLELLFQRYLMEKMKANHNIKNSCIDKRFAVSKVPNEKDESKSQPDEMCYSAETVKAIIKKV